MRKDLVVAVMADLQRERQVHFAFIFRHDALFSGLYHTGFKLATINFDGFYFFISVFLANDRHLPSAEAAENSIISA
jgi:hypothetical protein